MCVTLKESFVVTNLQMTAAWLLFTSALLYPHTLFWGYLSHLNQYSIDTQFLGNAICFRLFFVCMCDHWSYFVCKKKMRKSCKCGIFGRKYPSAQYAVINTVNEKKIHGSIYVHNQHGLDLTRTLRHSRWLLTYFKCQWYGACVRLKISRDFRRFKCQGTCCSAIVCIFNSRHCLCAHRHMAHFSPGLIPSKDGV